MRLCCGDRMLRMPIVAAIAVTAAANASAADWPHWRGPQRNGVVEEDSGWDGSRWVIAFDKRSGRRRWASEAQDEAGHSAWQRMLCLDFESGRKAWEGAPGHGDPGSCLLTADGRLIAWTGRGRLTLFETAERFAESLTVLAEIDGLFRTEVWPHVVLSGERLYCKDRDGNIKCLPIGGG